ncbi:hypothetical protein C5167_010188 [Papaver somniferum]|uniref:CTLH domain-containing protein n=1 Tax=Papaver somniferum TaxID=3469 RepID=A0A4Y7K0M8_PAPSO|nr:hypothetical protein C5167_010188 [Papaver somniferum]
MMDLDPRQYDNVAIDDGDVRSVVLSYLVHNCFKETADSFVATTGVKVPDNYPVGMDKRKPIYHFALEGNALKAIELTEQLSPNLLEENMDLHFDLLSLHFVELVCTRKCSEALEFAQSKLTPFGRVNKYVEKLEDFMALLAYEEPENSPMFHLLSSEYRQHVAESLNGAILGCFLYLSQYHIFLSYSRSSIIKITSTLLTVRLILISAHSNMPSYSALQRLLQQTTVVRQSLHQESNKDEHAPFSLKAFLKS